jgi:hypothetical protein
MTLGKQLPFTAQKFTGKTYLIYVISVYRILPFLGINPRCKRRYACMGFTSAVAVGWTQNKETSV